MCMGRGIEGAIRMLLGHRCALRRLPVLRPRERRALVWRLASHDPSFDLSGDAEAPPERGRFEGYESACKPDPVVDGHLSGTYIAASLVRSTRDVAGGPPCPCSTLLRMGFAEPSRSPGTLVVSYTTVSPLPVGRLPGPIGGLLSVALSVGSPRLGVTQHPALWSPDFPRPEGRGRLANSHNQR